MMIYLPRIGNRVNSSPEGTTIIAPTSEISIASIPKAEHSRIILSRLCLYNEASRTRQDDG